jgi:hypothetical protein
MDSAPFLLSGHLVISVWPGWAWERSVIKVKSNSMVLECMGIRIRNTANLRNDFEESTDSVLSVDDNYSMIFLVASIKIIVVHDDMLGIVNQLFNLNNIK